MKALALRSGGVSEADTVTIGTIMPWPLGDAPDGWVPCDGAVLDVAAYPLAGPLFGDAFGGDGVATFGVPTLADPVAGVGYIVALVGASPVRSPKPMTLTGVLPATARVGTAYHGTLTLGGDFTAPVTIDAVAGAIPAWLVPSVAGKVASFDGTPDADGTVNFTPRATDAAAQVAVGAAQSIAVSAAGGWATWGTIGANTVLSNSNQTMQGTDKGSYGNARAPSPLTGKAYFEIDEAIVSDSFTTGAGVAGWDGTSTPGSFIGAYGDADVGAYLRDDGYGTRGWYVYFGGSTIFSGLPVGGATFPNYRIGIAVDTATRKVWLRVVWSGGATAWAGGGNPATGTTPTATLAGTNPIYAAASSKAPAAGTCTATLVADPAEMFGAPPAGFTAGVPAP